MTREEAKELLPIIQAFAEGKTIECKNLFGSWTEAKCPSWANNLEYRIKPEPRYRPFKTQEECWQETHNHHDFGWVKNRWDNSYLNIDRVYMSCDGVKIITTKGFYTLAQAFENLTFADGIPFGIREE